MPSGLTEAEYKKKLADEKNKKVQNKSRFPKGIAFLDMGAWVDRMEAAQRFNGDKYTASGHTYAKNKYESKEEFDRANGRK